MSSAFTTSTNRSTRRGYRHTQGTTERYARCGSLARTPKPAFGVGQLAVTREAADKLAALFNKLTKRGIDGWSRRCLANARRVVRRRH